MLRINQGKQDASSDNKFEPIVAKGVFGKISKIELSERFDNSLNITIDIIENETFKNRKVFDMVTFDPKSDHSWKYRSLRKCVSAPYSETEGAEIDIEKILLNKKVKMNLDIREGNDGNQYQKVTYIAPKKKTDESPAAVAAAAADDATLDDEDEITADTEW